MADQEQLRILYEKGVYGWNNWRENNPDVEIDLRDADLYFVYLHSANFTDADLRGAKLDRADLIGANLIGADLRGAYLHRAKLDRANLDSANLRDAKLIGVYLGGANLTGADLRDAYLNGIQALAANFSGATLTGACIKDWNINSETNLENVICEYIYLKEEQQERRPASGNFAPGEFAKLVEKSIETVDLIFNNGIDWRAFLTSFQDLRVEYGEQNVSIQAIEKKSDGAFVIRLSVPPDADKAEVESKTKQSYETNLKVLEAQYRAELQAKDREITLYKEQGSNMMEIARLLASRPINVEAKAVAESKSQGDTYNQSGNIGIGHMSGGEIKGDAKVAGNMNVYASEQKQTLAEAADEIQKLLQQLEKSNPTATEEDKIEHLNDETTPKFKRKAVAALKAAGDTAIDEFFLDNSYVKVGKAAIMGWMDA